MDWKIELLVVPVADIDPSTPGTLRVPVTPRNFRLFSPFREWIVQHPNCRN